MTTSGVEEFSTRLLAAFHDLSGGRLKTPVAMDDAARKAGLETDSTESDVALRYLLNGRYLEAADETAGTYCITVPGMDRVRQARNPGSE